ncbi:hypothetical protein Q7C_2474 [Methylophaga frappieri]|uniref:Uncharacterized protein n=1 Tax=Methylophaga frappieri (strain ATCC BAA-2434 / DSM 25690 / JAM7) TaxID=754477 RepID=I1YL06_METFJ|nr:hypothetical protein Q7C_2474 [Methylophaga frappieri]
MVTKWLKNDHFIKTFNYQLVIIDFSKIKQLAFVLQHRVKYL